MAEIWKDIKGYEGQYQVSNFGNIRSLDRLVYQQGRMQNYQGGSMNSFLNNSGYYTIRLSKDNHKKDFLVHRLVAEAFLPNPYNLPCINHKDEDPLNNHVDNLEWCTREYNTNYGTATLRRALKMGHRLAQYDKNGNFITSYYSIREAERKTGIKWQSIGSCINGNGYTAGGFRWTIVDEEGIKLHIESKIPKDGVRIIRQYSLDLEFVAEYKSSRDVERKTGFRHEDICACCRGVLKSSNGFIWRYDSETPQKVGIRSNQKTVIQYDLQMNEIKRFDSIVSASRSLGGGKSAGIKQCIYGKNKTAYGYKWRYA